MTRIIDAVISNPCAFLGFCLVLIIVFDGLASVIRAWRKKKE